MTVCAVFGVKQGDRVRVRFQTDGVWNTAEGTVIDVSTSLEPVQRYYSVVKSSLDTDRLCLSRPFSGAKAESCTQSDWMVSMVVKAGS